MKKFQVVVFDLYGTLIYLANQTKPYAKLFKDINLNKNEFKLARKIAITEVFEDFDSIVERLQPNVKIDTSLYELELKKELSSAQNYPETINVLSGLKKQKIKLGLISNLASAYKKPFYNLGLEGYFDEILFSCDVGLRKPDSKIYEKIIDKFEINPSEILMIGDSINSDFDGPKAIGMDAVHLNRDNNSTNSISNLTKVFQYI